MYKSFLVAHTTEDISDVNKIKELLNICGSFFDGKRFDHDLDLDSPGKIFERVGGKLSDSKFGNDILRFGLPGDNLPRLWIHVIRLFGESARKSIRADGYVQNDVRLSFTKEETLVESFDTKIISLAKELSSVLGASFCYLATAGTDNYTYLSKSGLAVGLRDIYWLAIFGQEYLEMPGFGDAIIAHSHRSEFLSNGKLLATISQSYSDVFKNEFSNLKDKTQEQIGRQYFCDEDKVVSESSGVIGIFSFIKERFLKEREFSLEKHASKVRPEFDFGNIYLRESEQENGVN